MYLVGPPPLNLDLGLFLKGRQTAAHLVGEFFRGAQSISVLKMIGPSLHQGDEGEVKINNQARNIVGQSHLI